MTVSEAILTLNANVIVACERARFDSATVKMIKFALVTIDGALQAQEPRVMTFDEVKKHYNLPSVFPDDLGMQEDYYQDIQPLYFEFPNPYEWDVHWRGSNQVRKYLDEWEDRYNKTWRCWTSRPTAEQREAVKWDG